MNFLGRPGDILIALEKGDKGIVVAFHKRPRGEPDLNGSIGLALGRARRLEVDGGEDGVANFDRARVLRAHEMEA